MALYTEISGDRLARFMKQDEEERLRQLQAQAQTTRNQINANTGGLGGLLGGIVGGIGKGIGDIAKGTFGVIGGGVAGVKDLIEGTAGSQKNQNDFKRWLYDAETDKDAAAKAAGTALNAATTLGSTVVPGLAGGAAAKLGTGIAANTAAGAIGGIADEFQYQGANANMDSAANRALSGAAAGLATAGLNRKIGNATGNISSKLLNNKLATSTLGRGALSGAVGGATGAGTSAALGGGDVAQAALQGATSGALAGATQAGLMSGANRLGQRGQQVLENKWKEADPIRYRINKDETFKNIRNKESLLNSDVAKQIGTQISDNDLDMYRRAQNGGVLTREEIENSDISKAFKEYSNTHNDFLITPDQEKALTQGINPADAPVDQKIITKMQNVAKKFLKTDDSYKTAKNEGKAVVVLGLPASGKSSNAVDQFIKQGYFNLDNDNIKKLFPEYNNGLGAGVVHNASSYVSNGLVLPKIAGEQKNVVIPVIGKGVDSLNNYAKILREAGYKNVDLVNVDLPTDKTATRNFTRMLETGRNVAMDYIYDVVGDKPTINYNNIKERIMNGTEPYFTSYATISTDVPYKQPARIIENSAGIQLPGVYDPEYLTRPRTDAGNLGNQAQRGNTGQPLATNSNTNELNEFRAYGDSQLANRTRGNQTAEALRRFGNSLEGAQTNITRAAARDLGIESTGKVIENIRKKTGLTNLETQAVLAKELTGGADSLMDTVQRNALAATEDGSANFTADTTKLLGEVEAIVRKYANRTNMKGENGLFNLVNDVRNDIMSRDTDLISKANNFKASAQELRGKGIVNPSEGDSAKAKIYTEIAKKLDDLSYSAIPKENVEDMFGATIGEMRARANQARNNGNREIANAYETLANNLDKEPRTIQAYRSFKKDFVDIAKINQLTARAENGAGLQLGNNAAGALKRFGNTLLNRPINAALAKAGGAVNSVANVVDTLGGVAATTPTQQMGTTSQNILGNYIGRTEGLQQADNNVRAGRAAEAQQNLEGLLGEIQTSQNNIAALDELTKPKVMTQAEQALQNIAGAMNNALTAGDIQAYNELAKLYGTAYDVYQAQTKLTGNNTGESELTTAEKNQLAKFESAGTALDELEDLYRKAGGGQGIIGGNIANFLGGLGLNSDVNTYNQLAQGLINQIGAAIGKTDSLNTEGEVQRALSLVPKITDDNQTAMNKLESLRRLLQTNTGTYNQLYGA